MDVIELLERIDPSHPEPVYLVQGAERFLIDQLLDRLKAAVAAGPMGDLNCQTVKAEEISGEEIKSRCLEIPMMATRRLLVVEDAAKLKADDWNALEVYLAEPAPETCLVLVSEKLDLRRGPLQRANKRGQVHRADPIKDRGIGPFLRGRAVARGVRITGAAVNAVGAAVGPDCAALDDALERLTLFAGDAAQIDEDHVAEVVSNVRAHSIFELVDAVGARNGAKALSLLAGLLRRREEPIMVSAMVARHIRQLLGARIHLHRRTNQRDLPGLLGAPPFMVRKLMEQARRFRGADLEAALARLARADLELKSSRRSGALVIEEAVLDLCLG
jgi:DNA polymerase III subunit delta